MKIRTTIISLLAVLCLHISALAQDDIYVYGTVKDYVSAKKLPDIKITIFKNGAKIQEVVTGANGKYEFNLDFGADYKMVYEGGTMVSKNILIDTRNIPEEERQGGFGMNVDMTLFKETPGLDVSILDKPIGKAKYQAGDGALSWDYEYTREIQDELRRLMREFEQKQKDQQKLQEEFAKYMSEGEQAMSASEYSRAVSSFSDALGIMPNDPDAKNKLAEARAKFDEEQAADKKQADFDAAMAAGDGLFQQEKYEEAKAKYQQAQGIKPTDPAPPKKIGEVDKKLAELAALAEQQRKQKELDDNYNAAIAAADKAFQAEDYDLAKLKYNDALALKGEEQYPKDQLNAITAALAALAAKEEEERRRRELEAQYQSLISEADIAFKAENYDQASGKYNEALGLMPDEQYPKDQLAAIATKLEELAAAEAAAKAAAEKQAQYDVLVQEGNALFAEKDYERSRSKFQDALGIMPDEQYPKDKIAEIAKKLEEMAAAEAAAQAAAEKQAQYQALMDQAEAEAAAKEYDKAISTFRDAHGILPEEQLPLDRIAEIEDIQAELARQEEMKRLAEQEEAERRASYDKLIADADGLFDAEDYSGARSKYTSASELFTDEPYPKQRIAEIDDLLAAQLAADEAARLEAERLAAEKAAEEAAKLAAEEAEAAKRQQYDDLIAMADDAFGGERYPDAKAKYQQALDIFPGQPHPTNRLAEIEELMKQRAMDQAEEDRLAAERAAEEAARLEAERKAAEAARLAEMAERDKIAQAKALEDLYRSKVLEADMAFGDDFLSEARSLYTQALDIKPDESYPKSKIEQIDKLLAAKALKDQEAERLAEEQRRKDEEERARRSRNTLIDRGKEKEAEQFMREARLREEAEKWERIKKQRAALQEEEMARADKAYDRREQEQQRFDGYNAEFAEFFVGSEEQRIENADAIARYKQQVQEEKDQNQDQASEVRTQHYASITAEREGVEETFQRMEETHLNSVRKVDQSKIDEEVANRERITKEGHKLQENNNAVDQVERSVEQMAQTGSERAKDGYRLVQDEKVKQEADKSALEQRAKDNRSTTKDELGRIEHNRPKDFKDYHRSKLASEYPEGVTEESYTEGNKVIIRRVVVQGNRADDYSKVIAKWGTYYFRNGQSITEQMWINDTTSTDG